MDDQKNKPGQGFGENGNDKPQQTPESSSSSSYYYSYGPFQSYGKNGEEPRQGDSYDRRQHDEVEITKPQPVKPIPTSSFSGYSTSDNPRGMAGNGNMGALGSTSTAPKNANWQYNERPKRSSFKSVFAGMLAGMLILTGAMVFADRTNLFTPDTAANVPASAAAPESKPATGDGGSSAKTSTVVFPMTNPGDVTSVVQQAGPAVVKIETLVKAGRQSQRIQSNDPFYRFFFGDDFYGNNSNNGGSSSNSNQLVPTGIGSGFIFDKTGYILTNEHVVHNADIVQVTLQDSEKPYEAKVLGTSYELDLAVLKIEGDDNFPSIPLGNSDNTQVGEWLVAIGNPQGFDHTVTAGVLSAKERGGIRIAGENGEKDREYEHLLQTDASINPGNSGGPLLNLNGEVVGINVAVSSDAQGIGFAIPTSTVTEVLDKLKNNEEIPKKPVPFIGATLMTMTDEVAKEMGTDVTEGSVVSDIVFKSPAYNADLRPYDIITGADGKKYVTKEDLIAYIQKQSVGTVVTFNVVRDGKKIDLKVTIGDRNEFPNIQ
ncbi:S1C family serine protease [Paenibacillus lentus]|uniref:Trypsin-like serine protease n=1 Tax=Paenibacillus lentus TaxID=1338368 RepID=A0A3Q8S698_9BACL|nr:trypsin-like peptidase domain-containing protein [Paenibacillus lentus]AZK48190.1 trypsin-like serine protease [Paenibacillus lentus]